MPAVIFNGSTVLTLADGVQIGSGNSTVYSGTFDPSSVGYSGIPGDLFVSAATGDLYVKADSGFSTNWQTFFNTPNLILQAGDEVYFDGYASGYWNMGYDLFAIPNFLTGNYVALLGTPFTGDGLYFGTYNTSALEIETSSGVCAFAQPMIIAQPPSFFNGDYTTANGLTSVIGSVNQSGATSSILSTPICTTNVGGLYEVKVYQMATTLDVGTLETDITWNDGVTNHTTSPAPNIVLNTTNYSQGSITIYVAGGVNINFSTTLMTTGSPAYAVFIAVTRVM